MSHLQSAPAHDQDMQASAYQLTPRVPRDAAARTVAYRAVHKVDAECDEQVTVVRRQVLSTTDRHVKCFFSKSILTTTHEHYVALAFLVSTMTTIKCINLRFSQMK